jgi:hypothetical protein
MRFAVLEPTWVLGAFGSGIINSNSLNRHVRLSWDRWRWQVRYFPSGFTVPVPVLL